MYAVSQVTQVGLDQTINGSMGLQARREISIGMSCVPQQYWAYCVSRAQTQLFGPWSCWTLQSYQVRAELLNINLNINLKSDWWDQSLINSNAWNKDHLTFHICAHLINFHLGLFAHQTWFCRSDGLAGSTRRRREGIGWGCLVFSSVMLRPGLKLQLPSRLPRLVHSHCWPTFVFCAKTDVETQCLHKCLRRETFEYDYV